jgi:type I restriction enzyme M protein
MALCLTLIDARNVYRKVTRKINDFSPEQLGNISAIVWLYRGQRERFLALVKDYFGRVCTEIAVISGTLETFETTLSSLRERIDAATNAVNDANGKDDVKTKALAEGARELKDAVDPYETGCTRLVANCEAYRKSTCKILPSTNDKQHAARKAFEPIAEGLKGLVKQVDLLYKLAARAARLV